MAVGHTQYTLTNAVAAVYTTDWALKYMTGGVDSVTYMIQMTDSDFTVNE